MKTFLPILLLFLFGCATTPHNPDVWYHPNKSMEEARQDLAKVRFEIEKSSGSAFAAIGIGPALAERGRKNRMFEQGMIMQGYTRTKFLAVPSGAGWVAER